MNDKAVEIGQAWRSEAEKDIEQRRVTVPETQEKLVFTTAKAKEILVFEDAIQVRGQNKIAFINKRLTKIFRAVPQKKTARLAAKEKSPPVFTNVVMLQKKNREFEHMVAPIDEKGQETVSLPDMLKSRVIEEYGQATEPLPVVAITDGAQVIRQHLYRGFWSDACHPSRLVSLKEGPGLESMIAPK
ncbi:MAG: hypothetical protein IPK63_02635 [Candidatus Competibacteraceae bacterium]|nr:hypothetical protein [Candidatus Competibacteraceae bacterium]